MSNSSLVTYTLISPHRYTRTAQITKITIHHVAGVANAVQIGANFQGSNVASSNYGIGNDGSIGMYVEEKDRAVTSSNTDNDNRAVTIEVSNSATGDDWPVSDIALSRLLDLCVDICRRNGIARLTYTGNASGNLTRHNMFAATTCPGPYLESRFPYIAEEVNQRLEDENMTGQEIYDSLMEYTATLALPDWAQSEFAEAVQRGITDGTSPMQPIPRYQAAIMALRAIKSL